MKRVVGYILINVFIQFRLQALKVPAAHETAVKVGGYLLGEFGHLLKESGVSGADIFETLHHRFPTASQSTRALLLSSYMKLVRTPHNHTILYL